MIVRSVSWIVVAAFLFSLVPLEALISSSVGARGEAAVVDAHHGPCPDETPDGAPCPDGCACLCCPGHLRTLPPEGQAVSRAPLHRAGALPGRSDDVHPLDVHFDIFRPPRSV